MNIGLGELTFLGSDLRRPECVLPTSSGDLFVSDEAGVAMIGRDGATRRIVARGVPEGFMPNGIALLADRSFLIANLGPAGGVWHLAPSGEAVPYLLEVDGHTLPPTNFVGIDGRGRTWITVSTRLFPRTLAARTDSSSCSIRPVPASSPTASATRMKPSWIRPAPGFMSTRPLDAA